MRPRTAQNTGPSPVSPQTTVRVGSSLILPCRDRKRPRLRLSPWAASEEAGLSHIWPQGQWVSARAAGLHPHHTLSGSGESLFIYSSLLPAQIFPYSNSLGGAISLSTQRPWHINHVFLGRGGGNPPTGSWSSLSGLNNKIFSALKSHVTPPASHPCPTLSHFLLKLGSVPDSLRSHCLTSSITPFSSGL